MLKRDERIKAVHLVSDFINSNAEADFLPSEIINMAMQLLIRIREPKAVMQRGLPFCEIFTVSKVIWQLSPADATKIHISLMKEYLDNPKSNIFPDNFKKEDYDEELSDLLFVAHSAKDSINQGVEGSAYMAKLLLDLGIPLYNAVVSFENDAGKGFREFVEFQNDNNAPSFIIVNGRFRSVLSEISAIHRITRKSLDLGDITRFSAYKAAPSAVSTKHCVCIEQLEMSSEHPIMVSFKLYTYGKTIKMKMPLKDFAHDVDNVIIMPRNNHEASKEKKFFECIEVDRFVPSDGMPNEYIPVLKFQ